MNDKTADSNKRRLAVAASLGCGTHNTCTICGFLLPTEMFGKTQSLSVRTFLMDPRGMSYSEAAVVYMSRGMLPFLSYRSAHAIYQVIYGYHRQEDDDDHKCGASGCWKCSMPAGKQSVDIPAWQWDFSYWDIRWTYIWYT